MKRIWFLALWANPFRPNAPGVFEWWRIRFIRHWSGGVIVRTRAGTYWFWCLDGTKPKVF